MTVTEFDRYSYQRVGQHENQSNDQSLNSHLDEELQPFDSIEAPQSATRSIKQSINQAVNDMYSTYQVLPRTLRRAIKVIGLIGFMIIILSCFGSGSFRPHPETSQSTNQTFDQSRIRYHSVDHSSQIPINGFLHIPYVKPVSQLSSEDDETIHSSVDRSKGLIDSAIYHSLLLQNGLEVLLISDQSIDQSSASVTVGVGSWMDYEQPTDQQVNQPMKHSFHQPLEQSIPVPMDRPIYGLAHLVEHALFLGSARSLDRSINQSVNQSANQAINQSVNAFSQFLSAHSGYTNAFTAEDQSTYLFAISCNEQSTDDQSTESPIRSGREMPCFYSALGQFAQLVSAPLFDDQLISQSIEPHTHHSINTSIDPSIEEAINQSIDQLINQEKKAVTAEHAKNVPSNDWRQWNLFKNRSNPNHPFSHWGTGSIDPSIYRRLDQSINQSIDRQDVRKHMAALHRRFYVPKNMKLVVASDQSIDELIEWVVATFGTIKDRPLVREAINQSANQSTSQSISQSVNQPVHDLVNQANKHSAFPIVGPPEVRLIESVDPSIHMLTFFFSVTPRVTDWSSNHYPFINQLIERLTDCLVDRSWIHDIKTGHLVDTPSLSVLDWSIRLTGTGLIHWMTIVDLVNQYLQLIDQSINQPVNGSTLYDRWIEWNKIQSINFDLSTKLPAVELTQKLSNRLSTEPIHQVLHSPYQSVYDELSINQSIKKDFKIDNAIIHLMSSSINPSIFDRVEPIYLTRYAVFDLPSINQSISNFNGKVFIDDQKTNDQSVNPSMQKPVHLFLPAANRFVPDSVKRTIKLLSPHDPRSASQPESINQSANQLLDSSLQSGRLRVFVHPDCSFRQPRSVIYINVVFPADQSTEAESDNPCSNQSINQSVMVSIYAKLIQKVLSAELQAAELVGYDQLITQSNNQMNIKLTGLSDKMVEFAQLIIDGLLNDDQSINQSISQLFPSVRSFVLEELKNQFGSLAYEQSVSTLRLVINQSKLSINQSVKCVQSIELDDYRSSHQLINQSTNQSVSQFIRQLWQKSSITLFTYGFVDDQLTEEIAHLLINQSIDQSVNQSGDQESGIKRSLDQSTDQSVSQSIVHLPPGDYLAQREILNTGDPNVAVIFHHPIYRSLHPIDKSIDQSIDQSVDSPVDQSGYLIKLLQLEIVYQTIKQSIYDELRTRQQLGYIVAAFLSAHPTIPQSATQSVNQSINQSIDRSPYRALNIVVQGTDRSAYEIGRRIEQCLHELAVNWRDQPINQSIKQIQVIKDSLIVRRKRSRLIDMQQVGDLEWEEILNNRLMFDRRQREIDILQSTNETVNQSFSPSALIEFFVENMVEPSTRTRLIVNTVQDESDEHALYVEHAVDELVDGTIKTANEGRLTVIDMDHLNEFHQSIEFTQ